MTKSPGSSSSGKGKSRGKPCLDFAKGSCKYGNECRFSHAQGGKGKSRNDGSSSGVCYKFKETGSCKFGDECRYKHVRGG